MNAFSSISFLNSAFLFGLLALGVPVIIHLVSRLRYTQMDFSSLQFLEYSSRRTSRKFQLMNVLLLLARVALLAAFTLALARPLLLRPRPAAATTESCAVIIIDNSYSMGYTTRNQTGLDRAKRAAGQFVEQMRERDRASVLVMNESSSFVFEQPVHDREVLLKAVRAVPLSNRGTDVLPSLLEAYQLLEKTKAPTRRILLLTDLQRTGWVRTDSAHLSLAEQINGMLGALKRDEQRIPLYVVNCGAETYRNLGVTGMELGDQIISGGAPFELAGSVLVSGDHPEGHTLTASMHIGGRSMESARIALSRARTVTADFAASSPPPGLYEGYLELPPDGLAIDNRFYFALPVAKQVRVLLVRQPSGNRLSSGTALSLALRPEEGRPSFLLLRETSGHAFELPMLDESDVVVLADKCPALDRQRLAGFVADGGGVVVFPDADTEWLNDQFAGSDLLIPGRFTDERAAPPGTSIRIHGMDALHPASDFFGRHPSLLSAVRLNRCTPLSLATQPGVRGLASDGSGRCLVGERRLGKGRVLAFAFGCGLEWGNLPLTPALVPLLGETVLYLAGLPNTHLSGYQPGATVRRSFPGEGWQVRVETPLGEITDADTEQKDGQTWYEFLDTETPGIYTVTAESSAGTRSERFVVNLNTAESALVPASTADIASALPQAEIKFVLPGEAPETLGAGEQRIRLWGQLLLLAALLLIIEGYLATRVYRGEETTGQPVVTQ